MRFFGTRKTGSAPRDYVGIQYTYDYPMHDYQVKSNWPWPPAPAHETMAALTNCWSGNQLPGPTNFIPGVLKSKYTWNVPTSYANTLLNQQYNAGFNIHSYGAYQTSVLAMKAQKSWQDRGR